jgi:hypothetical protein
MKKALYTITAIVVLSLPTLAASAQTGAHPNGEPIGVPLPQQIASFSIGNVMLSILLNVVL